jgi:SAM-dependent methyltransferase
LEISALPLCCPQCSSSLKVADGFVRCTHCGADYASPFGVPVLVPGAKIENTPPPTDNFVRDVATALEAVGCEENLKKCFSLRLEMPDLHLQAEAEQFGHRLCASGHPISGLSAKTVQFAVRNIPSDIDVRLEPLVLPSSFVTGKRTGVNVRIMNEGQCSISSCDEPPLTLSYRWRKRPGLGHFWRPMGKPIEGARTPLLVDIRPGEMITQPIFIDAPKEAGKYYLEFALVLETLQWYLDCGPIHRCKVQEDSLAAKYTQNLDGPALSYLEQRQLGIDLLNKWLSSYINTSDPLVVEIGGNYNAASESIRSTRLLNIDVDFHSLMARNIVKKDKIVSIVADGMNIPVKKRSVDAIILFATFHHFPEPIQLLSRLRSKLKPGGLICLMCEPIGHVASHHNYTAYVEELEKGVYEQSFEIWEYEAFLEAAGLRIADAVFDRGAAMIAARV